MRICGKVVYRYGNARKSVGQKWRSSNILGEGESE